MGPAGRRWVAPRKIRDPKLEIRNKFEGPKDPRTETAIALTRVFREASSLSALRAVRIMGGHPGACSFHSLRPWQQSSALTGQDGAIRFGAGWHGSKDGWSACARGARSPVGSRLNKSSALTGRWECEIRDPKLEIRNKFEGPKDPRTESRNCAGRFVRPPGGRFREINSQGLASFARCAPGNNRWPSGPLRRPRRLRPGARRAPLSGRG